VKSGDVNVAINTVSKIGPAKNPTVYHGVQHQVFHDCPSEHGHFKASPHFLATSLFTTDASGFCLRVNQESFKRTWMTWNHFGLAIPLMTMLLGLVIDCS
jgi:hypothetical protein